MHWIKHVLVDVAVTALIAVAFWGGVAWAAWLVYGYTPFLLALKALAVWSPLAAFRARAAAEAPAWFYHGLYATNVLLLLTAGQPFWAALWGGIWVLSMAAAGRRAPRRATA